MHDGVFNGEVAFFGNTGQIRQRIKVLKTSPLTVQATADFQSCSDADGRCVPGSSSLSFGPLNVATAAAVAPKTPRATAAVLPEAKPAAVPTPKAQAPIARGAAAAIAWAAAVPTGTGVWLFGLLAFLAGLLTPCVFPKVPLTVSLLTSGQDSRRRGILKALAAAARQILAART
jgi:thiol:disulfide interchange protein